MPTNKHSATITILDLRILFPFLVKKVPCALTQGRLETIVVFNRSHAALQRQDVRAKDGF
jgi:hypothetical protein